MPIKIKPIHDFGYCTLDFTGIKGICARLEKEFSSVRYIAEDGIWSVSDEPSQIFLEAISQREKLNSFIAETPPFIDSSAVKVEAEFIENLIVNPSQENKIDSQTSVTQLSGEHFKKKIKLVFNSEEAKVFFDIQPEDQDWLDHFLLDIKKFIGPPTWLQRYGGIPLPWALAGYSIVISFSQPRCVITVKKRERSQRLIGISDNILANFLYDFLKFVIYGAIALFAAWVLRQFGIDLIGIFGGK